MKWGFIWPSILMKTNSTKKESHNTYNQFGLMCNIHNFVCVCVCVRGWGEEGVRIHRKTKILMFPMRSKPPAIAGSVLYGVMPHVLNFKKTYLKIRWQYAHHVYHPSNFANPAPFCGCQWQNFFTVLFSDAIYMHITLVLLSFYRLELYKRHSFYSGIAETSWVSCSVC